MRVVELGPADCPEIAALMRESYAAAFGPGMSEDALVGVLERLTAERFAAALPRDRILGLRGGTDLGGFVQIGPAPAAMLQHAGLPPDDPALELSRLYVAPARQRQGIGSALLDAALALAGAAAVVLDVWARNEGACRLYASRGFAVVGAFRPTFADGPASDPDLVMLRPGAPHA